MNYASIKPWDIANGPGVRVSLFVSGCTHHCKDCFNPETWDFDYGEPFDEAVAEQILRMEERDAYLESQEREPVSYTQLDVYKRQPRNSAARCRSTSSWTR